MKLDALDHPKTLDFAARLNVTRPTAIGHLELFWHFVSKHAPQGNVGKFPDGSIARACEWLGEPEEFLKSLLKSGFLDASEEHRYLVHDWSEHCPNWVRAQLHKLKRAFYVIDKSSEERTEERSYEGTAEPSTRARVSKPREAKPREAIVSDARDSNSKPGEGESRNGSAAPTPLAHARVLADHNELVERIQPLYPVGTWRGSVWILAAKAIAKRLDEGIDAELLIEAAESYAEQQAALGKVGTQYVLSPAKFYGDDGDWRGPFPLPKPAGKSSLSIDEMKLKYPEMANG